MPGLSRAEAALLQALRRGAHGPVRHLRAFLPLPYTCPWRLFQRLWPGTEPDWAWAAPGVETDPGARAGRQNVRLVGRSPIASGTARGTLSAAAGPVHAAVGQCVTWGPAPPGGWGRWPGAAVAWPFDAGAPPVAPWTAGDGGWRIFRLLLCAVGAQAGATWRVPLPAPLRAYACGLRGADEAVRAVAHTLLRQRAALHAALVRGTRMPSPRARAARGPAAPDRGLQAGAGALAHARGTAGGRSAERTFRARVAAAARDAAAGRLHKVVLARAQLVRAPAGDALSAWEVAQRLLRQHPTARIFLHALAGGGAFVGASPETLLALRHGRVFTHALAGTAKASGPQAKAAARALLASDKDRDEHAYVATAVRGALQALRVRLGAPKAARIVRAGALLHLETPFVGRAPAALTALAAAAALHPTPALAGVPRRQAMARLRQEEPWRGLYGGAVGWLAERDGHLAVAIRSALCTPRCAALFAGAGIVAQSQPAAEWRETQAKLQAMQAAVVRNASRRK